MAPSEATAVSDVAGDAGDFAGSDGSASTGTYHRLRMPSLRSFSANSSRRPDTEAIRLACPLPQPATVATASDTASAGNPPVMTGSSSPSGLAMVIQQVASTPSERSIMMAIW